MGKNDKPSLPKNWPKSVRYLDSPIYSPLLTKAELAAIRTRPADADAPDMHLPAGPSANVRITPIGDPRHPARGQSGLFAGRDLKPGEMVVAYFGEIHRGYSSSADAGADDNGADDRHARSDYDLWLDRPAGVAVDAERAGNEARFVNDYRGVPDLLRQRPNAEFRAVWDARRGEKAMAVFVLPAGKKAVGRARTVGIAKGQEILVSYGKGFWQERMEAELAGDAEELQEPHTTV